MGERVIEKTKCILEQFVFGDQQGCVCGFGRFARVEACSSPPMLKGFTFQQCSPITQAHHRVRFYPHSLACRSCMTSCDRHYKHIIEIQSLLTYFHKVR